MPRGTCADTSSSTRSLTFWCLVSFTRVGRIDQAGRTRALPCLTPEGYIASCMVVAT